jgi:hypothetical protein
MVDPVQSPLQGQPMNAVRPYHTPPPNTRQRRLQQMPTLSMVEIAVELEKRVGAEHHVWGQIDAGCTIRLGDYRDPMV